MSDQGQQGEVTVKCMYCEMPTTNIGNRICDHCVDEDKKGNRMKPKAYIFDLEGTLSNHEHRKHLFPDNPKVHADYDNYQSQFKYDPPFPGIITIAKRLQHFGFHIIISSGLPDSMRHIIKVG